MVGILKAIALGLGRVVRTPWLVLLLYLASLVLSLPLAFAVRDLVADSLGASAVAENLLDGFDMGWYGEFEHQHPDGLGATFGPWVVGVLPVLSHLERTLDGALFDLHPAVLTAGVAWLLLWNFLAGGILDRYAHGAPQGNGQSRFVSQCGEHFFRFLRLLVVSVLVYLGLFKGLGELLHDWVEDATHEVTEELQVLVLTFMVYALLAVVLVFFRLALDYARIAIVVEQRRSAVLALWRGLGFVLFHPFKVGGLFVALGLTTGVVVLVYSQIAPGPGQRTLTSIVLALVVSQVYLGSRLVLKLWNLAAETALYQLSQEVGGGGARVVAASPTAAGDDQEKVA